MSADAKQVLTVTLLIDGAGNATGKYETIVFETGSGESGKILSQALSSDLRATNHDLRLA